MVKLYHEELLDCSNISKKMTKDERERLKYLRFSNYLCFGLFTLDNIELTNIISAAARVIRLREEDAQKNRHKP